MGRRDEGTRERWDEGTRGRGSERTKGAKVRENEGRDGAMEYPVRFACGTVCEMNLAGFVERTRERWDENLFGRSWLCGWRPERLRRGSEGARERWGERISHKALKFNKNTAFALNYFIPREKVRGKLL